MLRHLMDSVTGGGRIIEIDVGADYVMVGAPDIAHAGHVGDEVTVTHRTEQSVYVLFRSGVRECFPAVQFATLFSRLR
jgi:hypothetical protein